MKLVYPPPGKIGIKVIDLDIASVSPSAVRQIKQLVYEYKLVIFPDLDINDLQYYEFARNIGMTQIDSYHPEYPGINLLAQISSQEKNLGIRELDKYFHTNGAFLEEPAPLTIVRTRMLPRSSRTVLYINMEKVYEKLPASLKRYIDGKNLIHEAKWHSTSEKLFFGTVTAENVYKVEEHFSVVQHPSVVVHPVTEAEILYMDLNYTTRIDGVDCQTSKKNLEELFAFIEQDRHIQPHILQDRYIHLWDNRTLNQVKFKLPKEINSIDFQIGINDGLPFYFSSIKEAIKKAQNKGTNFKQ